MAFGEAQSTYGEQDVIPSNVTYVLDSGEKLFYKVQSAPASVAVMHTGACADINVGPLTVPAAQQKTAKITAFSITSNVVTLTAINAFEPGDVVTPSGLGTGTYLNAQSLTVGSATATGFTAGFTHADVTLTSDSGTATQTAKNLYLKNVSRAIASTASPGNWY